MRVRYFFMADILDEDISEENDIILAGYAAIQQDWNKVDSSDDMRLMWEIVEDEE